MASSLQQLIRIEQEIKILEIARNGISIAQTKVEIGTNMSQEGYNVMYLTQVWITNEISKLKDERNTIIQTIEVSIEFQAILSTDIINSYFQVHNNCQIQRMV